MGRSKALLAPGGLTFLGRLTHALLEGGCDPVLVVVRDEAGPEAAEAHHLGLQPVINPDPAEGPISSLRVGLAALPTEVRACVWCPVDYPLVRADTVAALVAASAAAPDCIVLPAHRGRRGHPVVFPRELFARLAEPGLAHGARTVVREHPRRVTVAVDDPGILTDVDTPEDYRQAFGEASATLPRPATGTPADQPGDR